MIKFEDDKMLYRSRTSKKNRQNMLRSCVESVYNTNNIFLAIYSNKYFNFKTSLSCYLSNKINRFCT